MSMESKILNNDGIVFMPGEGKSISMMGVTILFKTVSVDTNGQWSLIEYTAHRILLARPLIGIK